MSESNIIELSMMESELEKINAKYQLTPHQQNPFDERNSSIVSFGADE